MHYVILHWIKVLLTVRNLCSSFDDRILDYEFISKNLECCDDIIMDYKYTNKYDDFNFWGCDDMIMDYQFQGSFCVCTQPMRGDVTM